MYPGGGPQGGIVLVEIGGSANKALGGRSSEYKQFACLNSETLIRYWAASESKV